jgi:hypothetical protein
VTPRRHGDPGPARRGRPLPARPAWGAAPRAGRRLVCRLAAALGAAAVAGLAGAAPAAADPPRPTDYRSTVDSVVPTPEGVDVAVVGGDSFLRLTVDEGHEVEVPGYEGEPYLRFRADGTVERNRNSPASYLNDDRRGAVEVPATAGKDADPAWEQVAGGGEYAWHDHAIHWMGGGRPPGKHAGDTIQRWTVELTVDGTPTTVSGTLVWEHPVSAWPWVALAALAAAAVLAAGHVASRRPGGHAALVGSAAAVVAAAVAAVVGWGQFDDAPAGSGVSPLVVAVPVAGLVAGVAALAWHRSAPLARALSLAAVATVLGWATLRLEVLVKPVLPTTLPAGADRAGTALAQGLAVAAAGVIVLASGRVTAPARPADREDGAKAE